MTPPNMGGYIMFFYMEPLLYLSSMNLDYPISELDRRTLNRIMNICIDWGAENLHPPFAGMVPECHIDSKTVDESVSHYDYDNLHIVFKTKQIGTLRHFLKCFLHEWYHSTQEKEEYWTLDSVHGYWKNPHEIDARRYEKMYVHLFPHLIERLGESIPSVDRRELWWGSLRTSLFGV